MFGQCLISIMCWSCSVNVGQCGSISGCCWGPLFTGQGPLQCVAYKALLQCEDARGSGDCGSFCCRKYTWRILFVRKPINTDVACGKYTRSTFSSVDRSPPALFIPAASRGLTQTQKLHSSPVGRPQSCKLNTSTTFPYVQMVQNNTLKL